MLRMWNIEKINADMSGGYNFYESPFLVGLEFEFEIG